MSGKKWVRRSLRRLGEELKEMGREVSAPTVGRLLSQLGFSLKANRKEKEAGQDHPDREAQFEYIGERRRQFESQGWPIVSVDTKKKELIGDFKNAGQSWCREAERVNGHDFPNDALCRAVPYGIYDVTRNQGYVYVGTSADTPEFAVEMLGRWWEEQGKASYPEATQLLILADAGGSNGCRPRSWKQQVQHQLSDRLGLTVTVCHYPTGCSKYNPIEHRLFSQISLNWAGRPLRTLDIALGYIATTTTTTGLAVKAFVCDTIYRTGIKVSDQDMEALNLERHTTCPKWNYTIRPRLQPLPS